MYDLGSSQTTNISKKSSFFCCCTIQVKKVCDYKHTLYFKINHFLCISSLLFSPLSIHQSFFCMCVSRGLCTFFLSFFLFPPIWFDFSGEVIPWMDSVFIDWIFPQLITDELELKCFFPCSPKHTCSRTFCLLF